MEALVQMPKYSKFLKDLLTNRKRIEEASAVFMNEQCSAAVLNQLPRKMSDPGSLTIPCQFGNLEVCQALADSGASINIMPYSFYIKLGLPEPRPIRMAIHLANKSITFPRGLAEDLIVKVDKFVFPADFVILDIKGDDNVPLILGRPFLCTAAALVDMKDAKLTLRVGNEAITFGLDQAMQYSKTADDQAFYVDTVEELSDEESEEPEESELKDQCILGEVEFNPKQDLKELKELLEEINEEETITEGVNLVKMEEESKQPDFETPTLKSIPEHLEYAFLGEGKKLPVIIAKDLQPEEKERLIEVLKKRKDAIAWKISDIKGISPTLCSHKILMEEDSKPTIQNQRRLNPKMMEVVRKEVLKLMDAGIIYAISDSKWVSPIHVVPKKVE